ncbi:MAG: ABC transporter ATP-binding protein [Phycisphaeraceae bacterium]|nr:ABC transporter ATP-binding protein [Phycisphaeraceae bacterium]
MTDVLVKLKDIRRTFRMGEISVHVLRGISLEIERGAYIALTGSSGSGKTTLMNLLGCLDRPTSGEYWLDGLEVSRMSSDARAMIRNKKIGFVFQNFNLLPRTTALEQVMMPLAYTATGLSERNAKKRAVELLKMVGLGERMDHRPSQLSGGQQQRVAIARALINQPPILFADEPTGNLDSRTTAEILEMFDRLNRTEGITIILVTHDPTVAGHARRNIRLRDGMVESDTIREGPPPTLPSHGEPAPDPERQVA